MSVDALPIQRNGTDAMALLCTYVIRQGLGVSAAGIQRLKVSGIGLYHTATRNGKRPHHVKKAADILCDRFPALQVLSDEGCAYKTRGGRKVPGQAVCAKTAGIRKKSKSRTKRVLGRLGTQLHIIAQTRDLIRKGWAVGQHIVRIAIEASSAANGFDRESVGAVSDQPMKR